MNLKQVQRWAEQKWSEYQSAKKTYQSESENLRVAIQQVQDTKQAQEILQAIAQEVQQQAHERIAKLVSRCLTMVFEQPYQFEIDFARMRGKTEARLQFKRGQLTLEDPMDEAGGGVIDVAAFAMRLACIALAQPRSRPIIIMDEPMKFVSAEFIPNVRKMLESLSVEMGFLFIMVTHIEELQVGNVIRIE